ncbi:hypothetical protein [Citreicoccus inhibens]|uniref:hypothetical protein n=1 Tax=Citreicoccus inhibens TaxID=2849499 RepID=UPI001EF10C94|nr:hypothetical protein [Citreicoccus inhibens]
MEPVAAPPPATRSRRVLVVLGLGGLVLVAAVAGFLASHASSVSPEQLANEARVQVLALCDAVQAFRDEHGNYVTAGPLPRPVPRHGEAVPFPHDDESFQRIGFNPGPSVHFQYEVTVQESPVGEPEVSCVARIDTNGDGHNAVYRVRLDANGMTSPVEVQHEGE